MYIDVNYKVDICKGIVPIEMNQPLYYSEENAHRINVSLFDGIQEVTLDENAVCNAYITVKSANQTLGPIPGDISGNTCSVVLPAEAYATVSPLKIVINLVEPLATQEEEYSVTTILSLNCYVAVTMSGTIIDITGAVVPNLDALAEMIEHYKQIIANTIAQSSSVTPVYIGDYLSGANKIPSCCVLIGDKFVTIDALTREEATQLQSNAGTVRWFDTANNVEMVNSRAERDVGHANSIAYDGSTVYVVPIWDNSTGTEVSANWLYTFDNTMTPIGTDALHQDSTSAMGVSYDHAQHILYYLDYLYRIYAKIDGVWTLACTVDMTGINVSDFNFGASFNQDFAVHDGMFYISSPRGVIIYGKISEGIVQGGFLVSSMDVTCRYMMGELEGMEFDGKGHLYAVMTSGLSSDVRNAFVVELPVGVVKPNASSTDSYDFHDGTLTLSNATQIAFWLQPYQIRSLAQLEIRMLRYNSSVIEIPENNDVIDDYDIRINDRIKLLIKGKLTVKKFSIFSGLLNLCCESADSGTPRLVFTTSNAIPLSVTRAGELAITGSQQLRISIPNFSGLTQLISVGYDYNRTTIRLVPISHESSSRKFRIGDTVELENYSVYVGTARMYGQSTLLGGATWISNSYFTRANLESGGFRIHKLTPTFTCLVLRLKPNAQIPAGTSVNIGQVPFVVSDGGYVAHTLIDMYGNPLYFQIGKNGTENNSIISVIAPTTIPSGTVSSVVGDNRFYAMLFVETERW